MLNKALTRVIPIGDREAIKKLVPQAFSFCENYRAIFADLETGLVRRVHDGWSMQYQWVGDVGTLLIAVPFGAMPAVKEAEYEERDLLRMYLLSIHPPVLVDNISLGTEDWSLALQDYGNARMVVGPQTTILATELIYDSAKHIVLAAESRQVVYLKFVKFVNLYGYNEPEARVPHLHLHLSWTTINDPSIWSCTSAELQWIIAQSPNIPLGPVVKEYVDTSGPYPDFGESYFSISYPEVATYVAAFGFYCVPSLISHPYQYNSGGGYTGVSVKGWIPTGEETADVEESGFNAGTPMGGELAPVLMLSHTPLEPPFTNPQTWYRENSGETGAEIRVEYYGVRICIQSVSYSYRREAFGLTGGPQLGAQHYEGVAEHKYGWLSHAGIIYNEPKGVIQGALDCGGELDGGVATLPSFTPYPINNGIIRAMQGRCAFQYAGCFVGELFNGKSLESSEPYYSFGSTEHFRFVYVPVSSLVTEEAVSTGLLTMPFSRFPHEEYTARTTSPESGFVTSTMHPVSYVRTPNWKQFSNGMTLGCDFIKSLYYRLESTTVPVDYGSHAWYEYSTSAKVRYFMNFKGVYAPLSAQEDFDFTSDDNFARVIQQLYFTAYEKAKEVAGLTGPMMYDNWSAEEPEENFEEPPEFLCGETDLKNSPGLVYGEAIALDRLYFFPTRERVPVTQ